MGEIDRRIIQGNARIWYKNAAKAEAAGDSRLAARHQAAADVAVQRLVDPADPINQED